MPERVLGGDNCLKLLHVDSLQTDFKRKRQLSLWNVESTKPIVLRTGKQGTGILLSSPPPLYVTFLCLKQRESQKDDSSCIFIWSEVISGAAGHLGHVNRPIDQFAAHRHLLSGREGGCHSHRSLYGPGLFSYPPPPQFLSPFLIPHLTASLIGIAILEPPFPSLQNVFLTLLWSLDRTVKCLFSCTARLFPSKF